MKEAPEGCAHVCAHAMDGPCCHFPRTRNMGALITPVRIAVCVNSIAALQVRTAERKGEWWWETRARKFMGSRPQRQKMAVWLWLWCRDSTGWFHGATIEWYLAPSTTHFFSEFVDPPDA